MMEYLCEMAASRCHRQARVAVATPFRNSWAAYMCISCTLALLKESPYVADVGAVAWLGPPT